MNSDSEYMEPDTIRPGSARWYVYVLECSDQTLYTGITTDLKRRTEQHNSSLLGAKYTQSRRPVEMVYSCEFPNKSEAQKEEYRIKKLTRKEKIDFINYDNTRGSG